MTEQLFTLKKAAEIIGVHPVTMTRWARAGLVKVVYLPVSNRPRIAQSEIDRIMTPSEEAAPKKEA
jgi:predicted site-specific integrase-resolvase